MEDAPRDPSVKTFFDRFPKRRKIKEGRKK
jgi:hypothetical protein